MLCVVQVTEGLGGPVELVVELGSSTGTPVEVTRPSLCV